MCIYIYVYDFIKVTPYHKPLPRESLANSELYVLPAYRKDTGRIPEGAKSLGKRHSESTQDPLGTSSLTQGTRPVSSHTVLSTPESLPEAGCPSCPWQRQGSGDPPHQSPPLLPQAIPSTGAAPRISCQNVLKHLHTGRIPEGYRKGTGRVPSPPLSGTRNNHVKRPAYRKDTGRIPEGYRKGSANDSESVWGYFYNVIYIYMYYIYIYTIY